MELKLTGTPLLILLIFLSILAVGYFLAVALAIRRGLRFKKSRETVKAWLMQESWVQIQIKKVQTRTQKDKFYIPNPFLSRALIFKKENSFAFLKKSGLDVHFHGSTNPIPYGMYEDAWQISNLRENDEEIEYVYNRQFENRTTVKLVKKLG